MIAYSPASTYARAILVGMLNTLKVAVIGIFLATILGTMIGVGRLSPNWLLAKICDGVRRGVPQRAAAAVAVLLVYKLISEAFPGPRAGDQRRDSHLPHQSRPLLPGAAGRPSLNGWAIALLIGIAARGRCTAGPKKRQDATGQPFPVVWAGVGLASACRCIGLAVGRRAASRSSWPSSRGFNFEGGTVIQPEFTALLVGLVLYTSAFIAEIVRSGILALHKGQSEAAMALGLSRGQVMRLVLLPQALRVIVPPMTSQYLNITKNSSLAIAIGYPDLVRLG